MEVSSDTFRSATERYIYRVYNKKPFPNSEFDRGLCVNIVISIMLAFGVVELEAIVLFQDWRPAVPLSIVDKARQGI